MKQNSFFLFEEKLNKIIKSTSQNLYCSIETEDKFLSLSNGKEEHALHLIVKIPEENVARYCKQIKNGGVNKFKYKIQKLINTAQGKECYDSYVMSTKFI